MTKKVKISFLILVWSIVAVQMFVNHQGKTADSNRVVTAFSVMEEQIIGECIKGYGYFGTMDLTGETKQEMLENLALKMGITDGYQFSTGRGDDFSKLVLTKEGKYATTILQLISITGEKSQEQYIAMQITTTESVEEAFGLYERVKQIYEEIGVEAQVSMEVELEQPGNIMEYADEKLVSGIFDVAGAKKVDSIEENGIYTVYGYIADEDSYLMLNHKKVNVQIAMFYDEEADKTYAKVGIPIVNSAY